MSEIRFDLSQYYPMKAVFEEVLGQKSFAKIKDCGSLKTWKEESIRLLNALFASITATVLVCDDEWVTEIQTQILLGISRLSSSSEIDEMFSCLAATLARITFLQVGFIPTGHREIDRVPIAPRHWKLDLVRSVQYVQNSTQRLAQQRQTAEKKTFS